MGKQMHQLNGSPLTISSELPVTVKYNCIDQRYTYSEVQVEWESTTHQLDEVFGHLLIVLVHSMHDSIDQNLLVGLAELCHIAKINISDAAVPKSENVSRVRVPMEQPELRPGILPQGSARCEPTSSIICVTTNSVAKAIVAVAGGSYGGSSS